ncbi:hypothetical protein HMPREF9071_0258 [Capnocytophaga sp. oral taxon 338 str. F0234]|nr:hypothetical protein HMPREF9071_0258 [Capnocytophaga sp. oral taxon 338 str. F0234]
MIANYFIKLCKSTLFFRTYQKKSKKEIFSDFLRKLSLTKKVESLSYF